MQSSGVQACAKHFSKVSRSKAISSTVKLTIYAIVGNEQELNRSTMSANIDDRTLHEVRDRLIFSRFTLMIAKALSLAICRRCKG